MYLHDIERTSPAEGPFLGKCRKCGRENLAAPEKFAETCPVPGQGSVQSTLRPASMGLRVLGQKSRGS